MQLFSENYSLLHPQWFVHINVEQFNVIQQLFAEAYR